MTVRSHTYDYELSSLSGREIMLRAPYARLKDVTPTVGDPFAVTALVAGMEVCGTVITLNAITSEIQGLVTEGLQFRHNVRNVRTYDGQDAEATWGPINFGDPVYYDPTADANTAGVCKLSTSPLEGDGATANPRFGTIVFDREEHAADFPKSDSVASPGISDVFGVAQAGLNES